MRTLIIIFLISISSVVLAQTPDKTTKSKETESGQGRMDTVHSKVISGSAGGKTDSNLHIGQDSLKIGKSSDTVIVDQPIPKGK